MSDILYQQVELARKVSSQMDLPAVSALYLPPLLDDPLKQDEFGFVFLEDGSVGPFYTRLDDDLEVLWNTFPDGSTLDKKLMPLIEAWTSNSQASRALALGAFNAMSHHLMREAGYSPRAEAGKKHQSSASNLAMVGYIRPMIEKLLQRGLDHVLVLERNPARVEPAQGIRLSTKPADLLGYDEILCTASTLINDSIGEIIQYKNSQAHLALIGPSASGLPDVLFRHGVDELGGIWIDDLPTLYAALHAHRPWGQAGGKYSLSVQNYPGVDKLLERARRHAR